MSDLISRQDAIDKVSEYASVWMSYTDGMSKEEIAQEALNSAKDTMIRIISELPSAQPDMSGYSSRLWKLAYERGKLDAQQEWIPVTERLPDEDGYYLVTGKKRSVHITGYSNGWWYGGEKPIAWMPLPEPYKGEK